MRQKGLTLLFILTFSLLTGCGFFRPDTEREPNDTPDRASPIRDGRTLRAELQQGGDVDYYVLEGKKKFLSPKNGDARDVVVSIALSSEDSMAVVIKVHRSESVKVIDGRGFSTEGENGGVIFANVAYTLEEIMNGSALISIERASDESSLPDSSPLRYEIDLTMRPTELLQEREPNDKPVQATFFHDSSVVQGFFDPPFQEDGTGEVDWFGFDGPAGGEKTAHISITAVPDVDPVLSVYDELGYLIRTVNSNGAGEGEQMRNLGVGRSSYFIKVETADAGQYNHEIAYSLMLDVTPADTDDIEPNDRYIHARSIEFNQDIRGYINPSGDIDWYRMVIYDTDRQVLSAKIGPTAHIDPVLSIYREPGKPILTVDDRGVDEGEIIRNIGLREGIYYLKVENRNTGRDNPNDQYTLIVEKRKWRSDEEYEINDTFPQANEIFLNGLKRGYLTPRGDRDLYLFEAKEEGDYEIEITPCLLLDLVLFIYDENGQILTRINNNPAEEGERGTVRLQKGRYVIGVANMNAFENSRDAYELRISKNAP